MTINNKYHIGQTVYLITDEQQLPRLIVSIRINPSNLIGYDLASGPDQSVHYEMEISAEKNVFI